MKIHENPAATGFNGDYEFFLCPWKPELHPEAFSRLCLAAAAA